MKRKNIWGDYAETKTKPYSEKFAIPVIPDSTYQKRLREQEICEHPQWEKIQTDNIHWRKVCLKPGCRKQFESEVIEETRGKEILI